jgi:hypothetical protein
MISCGRHLLWLRPPPQLVGPVGGHQLELMLVEPLKVDSLACLQQGTGQSAQNMDSSTQCSTSAESKSVCVLGPKPRRKSAFA